MFDENTFVISDTHFNHANIGVYCSRPKGWQDLIIDNWNNIVNKNDKIIHLGDFGFNGKRRIKDIFDSLNGEKYLIRGNHDLRMGGLKWWDDVGFTVLDEPYHFIIKTIISNIDIYLSHRPLLDIKFPDKCFHIFGHWHNKSPFTWYSNNIYYVNMSVENINYTPLSIINILRDVYKTV